MGVLPQVLILGSMPGRASLEQYQYYALVRNAFWPIMGELFGAGFDVPYAERLAQLQDQRIALWDVLASCYRPGSLDSAIAGDSVQANDFSKLFRATPLLTHVFFNGRTAADLYRRHVLPLLDAKTPALVYQTLPSTSPAHATRNFGQKLDEWTVVREVLAASAT